MAFRPRSRNPNPMRARARALARFVEMRYRRQVFPTGQFAHKYNRERGIGGGGEDKKMEVSAWLSYW